MVLVHNVQDNRGEEMKLEFDETPCQDAADYAADRLAQADWIRKYVKCPIIKERKNDEISRV